MNFTSSLGPVSLPPNKTYDDYVGKEMILIGWGVVQSRLTYKSKSLIFIFHFSFIIFVGEDQKPDANITMQHLHIWALENANCIYTFQHDPRVDRAFICGISKYRKALHDVS